MEFYEVVNRRTSVRRYKSERPSREQIERILEAARQAPSACNRQPWRFIVVESGEMLAKVRKAYDREWLATAPVVIVAVGNHAECWHRAADGKDHCDVDLAIAAEHIALAAANEGLGSCWICNFDRLQLSEVLSLTADEEPIVMLPIGYADEALKPHTRKAANEIISFV